MRGAKPSPSLPHRGVGLARRPGEFGVADTQRVSRDFGRPRAPREAPKGFPSKEHLIRSRLRGWAQEVLPSRQSTRTRRQVLLEALIRGVMPQCPVTEAGREPVAPILPPEAQCHVLRQVFRDINAKTSPAIPPRSPN